MANFPDGIQLLTKNPRPLRVQAYEKSLFASPLPTPG